MSNQIILPIEIINNILSYRPSHPNVKIIKNVISIYKEKTDRVSRNIHKIYTPSFYAWFFYINPPFSKSLY